jgi:hypothetical protein
MADGFERGEHEVVCQNWWWQASVNEPDGFSLHASSENVERFIRDYWGPMPDATPVKYSRPIGESFPLGVSKDVMRQVLESGDGVRFTGVDCIERPDLA